MGGGALLVRKDRWPQLSPVLHTYPVRPLTINLSWYLRRLVFNLLLSRLPYALMEKLPFLHLGETRLHLLGDICRLDLPGKLVVSGIENYWQCKSWREVYDGELRFLDQYGWIRVRTMHSDPEDRTTPSLRYALLAPTRGSRDLLVARLNEMGIAGSMFYGKPLSEIRGVSERITGQKDFPVAREFSSRLLTLPCHEGVTNRDIATIVACFTEEVIGSSER
jgi:hypothetical protein